MLSWTISNAILEFVRKNQELISCEKSLSSRTQVESRGMEIKSAQQEEINRLIQIKKSCSEEQFQQAAKDSYSKGTIYFRELQRVLIAVRIELLLNSYAWASM